MKYSICLVVFALFGLSSYAVLGEPASPLTRLGEATEHFGTELLKSLESAEHQKAVGSRSNVFISPYSVSTVLAMLLAGGEDQTYSQIYNTLGFSAAALSKEDVFRSYQALASQPHTKDANNVLSVANSIAVQKNTALLESFLGNITTYFQSQVFAEDFTQEAHKATEEINRWVNSSTNGKIAKLFAEDLQPDTVLVLLNAIYFKGVWKTRFAADHTTKAQFNLEEGHQAEVEMTVHSYFHYGKLNDGAQLLELPYQDESLAMYILLPAANSNQAVTSYFTGAHSSLTEAINSHLTNQTVTVHLPKFKLDHTYHLVDTLKGLGIQDAFSKANANFANIDGRKDPKERVLYLSDVIHKTFVEVNEEGSEAAAVTGGVINNRPKPGPPPPEEIIFRADHPFAFFIRDKVNSITLFSGVINKP